MTRLKPHLPALVFFALLLLLVFAPFFFRGYYPIPYNILVGWYFPYRLGGWSNFQPGIPFKGGLFAADVFRQMIPWKSLALSQLKIGQLPLWNPYNFSGEPLLANIQATVFYPLSIFFFLPFSFDFIWSLYIIASPLLTLIFTYFFLFHTGLSKKSSLLGALAFAFSGHMVSWLEWGVVTHTALWLPANLLGLNLWLVSQKKLGLFLVIFATWATITGGYPQEGAYSLLFAASYFLTLLYKHPLPSHKAFLTQSLIILLAVSLLTLPQIIPTAKLFSQSALKGQTSLDLFSRTQLDPHHLLTLFSPNYFGNRIKENYWADKFTSVDYTDANLFIGTPALIFALYGLIRFRRLPRFFLAAFLLTLALSLKSPLAQTLGWLQLPMISTGVAAGILYLTVFSLSVISAYGYQDFTSSKKLRPLVFIGLIYLIVTASLILVPPPFRLVAIKGLLPHLAIAFFLLIFIYSLFLSNTLNLTSSLLTRLNYYQKKLTPFRWHKFSFTSGIMIFVLFSSASLEYGYYTHQMLSFSPKTYSYPDHYFINYLRDLAGYDRVMGFWDSEIATDLHTQLRLFSTEGYNPLHLKHYQLLSAATKTGAFPTTIARSDADVYLDNSQARNRFLDLTSVKYIFSQVTDPDNYWEVQPLKFDPQFFSLVWQQNQFKIYQNLSALPRVSLFTHYEIISDPQTRINRLFDPQFNPHSHLILESPPGFSIDPQATGSAKIISYTPNQVIIQTSTQGGSSLLLLTDTYYSSWHATLDDHPTPILPANQSFRSLVIPSGQHTVKFYITWP